MNKIFYKKILIFDLDGVLIDSKINMQKSWIAVQKQYNLQKIKFDDYFSKIGQPFFEILKQLNINNYHTEIKKCYDKASIANLKSIQFFPGTINSLNKLIHEGFAICIVTSKDKFRTNLILNDTDRDLVKELINKMDMNGIEYRRGSAGGGNQLRQPYLRNFIKKDYFLEFPNTEHVHFYGFYLGNYPSLKEEEILKLCGIINDI